MFTCSSCGYEANPESAPACSLCGTKRQAKAGGSASGSKSEADAPPKAPAPAPKAPAPAAASASASKSAPKQESAPKKESAPPPKKESAPKKKDDSLDELASAAEAVANAGSDAPAETTRGARSKPAAGTTVVTSQGVLRMSTPPPDIENSTMLVGAFVGALLGYAFQWYRLAHAPSTFGEIVVPAVAMVCAILIGRFLLAPSLEQTLTNSNKELLHGPIAGVAGGAFAILAMVGFVAASRVPDPSAVRGTAGTVVVGASGEVVAQRIALLTPWTMSLKTEKAIVLSLKGKPEVRIARASLSRADVDGIMKSTGLTLGDLDRLASPDPSPLPGSDLPSAFSADLFLDRLSSVYGVYVDRAFRRDDSRQGTRLARRRKSGGNNDELLWFSTTPTKASDLTTALPRGVPMWIGLSLGIQRDSTPDHEAFVGEAYEKFRPQD